MLFRQLYDATSSTYSYLLADAQTREAVLIDPVFERHQRDAAPVRELGLKLTCTLDTHCSEAVRPRAARARVPTR